MDAHLKAQTLRFARISALAFLAAMATTGGQLSWASLWALGAGALETGLRQVLPVKPIPAVASVLASVVAPGLGLSEIPPGVVEPAIHADPGVAEDPSPTAPPGA